MSRLALVRVETAAYTVLALMVQFLVFAIMLFIAYAFIGILVNNILLGSLVDPFLMIWIITAIATIGWASILFRTPMLHWWFMKNDPLEGAVVGTLLQRNSILPESSTAPLKTFDSSSLREIGPGWHGKLPWEVLVDKKINLHASILIGNDKDDPLVVQSSDGIPVLVDWLARLTALRGYLVNHIQFLDDARIQEFRAKFVAFWLGWAKGRTADDIFNRMTPEQEEHLREEFRNLLGGKDNIHDFEKERGTFSGDPQLLGLEYDPKYAAALQAPNIMKRVGAGIDEIYQALEKHGIKDKLSPDLVSVLSAGTAGSLGDTRPIILVGAQGMGGGGLAAVHELLSDTKGKGEAKGKGKEKKGP